VVAGAVVACIAGGAALAGPLRRTTSHADPAAAASSASVTEAAFQKHLAASRAAWLGAAFARSREEATAALGLDDTAADAHFAMVRIGSIWPTDEDRSHFVKAQDGEVSLDPAWRGYLSALAPAMNVPADFHLSARRFEALLQEYPNDLEITIALADMLGRIGRAQDATNLLKPLASTGDPPAIVLSELSLAQEDIDDVDAARAALGRCVASHPAATMCAGMLSQLEMREGNCREAERAIRQSLQANSNNDGPHLDLAYVLDAEGTSTAEIAPVLQKWAELSGAAASGRNALQSRLLIALRDGRLDDALAVDEELARYLAGVDNDEDRFQYADYSMLLKDELGMHTAATAVLENYATTRHELRRSSYAGDNVTYLYAVATQLGLLSWDAWVQKRDARLATPMDRDALVDGPQRTWLEYYALPATTPTAAKLALQALDRYRPLLPRANRWFSDDSAIATVFDLGGQPSEASAYFQRAMRACTTLDSPVDYVHLMLRFAAHLEHTNDDAAACAVYERILDRWPSSARSRSVSTASSRRDTVCTATRSHTH
jgi:hypothetical protein